MQILSHYSEISEDSQSPTINYQYYFSKSWERNNFQVVLYTNKYQNKNKKKELFDNILKIKNSSPFKSSRYSLMRNSFIFDRFFFANSLPEFSGLISEIDIINKNFTVDQFIWDKSNTICFQKNNPCLVYFPNQSSVSAWIDLCIEVTAHPLFAEYYFAICEFRKRNVMIMESQILDWATKNTGALCPRSQDWVNNLIRPNIVLQHQTFYKTDLINDYQLFHINNDSVLKYNKNQELLDNYPIDAERRAELMRYILSV